MAVGRGSVKIGAYEFDRAGYSLAAAGVMLGGVTRQHLANMEERGELRTIRLGRRVLVPAAEIARLLGAVEEGDSPNGAA